MKENFFSIFWSESNNSNTPVVVVVVVQRLVMRTYFISGQCHQRWVLSRFHSKPEQYTLHTLFTERERARERKGKAYKMLWVLNRCHSFRNFTITAYLVFRRRRIKWHEVTDRQENDTVPSIHSVWGPLWYQPRLSS